MFTQLLFSGRQFLELRITDVKKVTPRLSGRQVTSIRCFYEK
jgi:hypothetical protein